MVCRSLDVTISCYRCSMCHSSLCLYMYLYVYCEPNIVNGCRASNGICHPQSSNQFIPIHPYRPARLYYSLHPTYYIHSYMWCSFTFSTKYTKCHTILLSVISLFYGFRVVVVAFLPADCFLLLYAANVRKLNSYSNTINFFFLP